MKIFNLVFTTLILLSMLSCSNSKKESVVEESPKAPYQLMTLDPGHFHAGLIQKTHLKDLDNTAYVFAPDGPDVQDHLNRIKSYNERADNPTHWVEEVYIGPDFFEKMIQDKPGNIMLVAGSNAKKTQYIKKAIEVGINVLADKPMAINAKDFEILKEAFELAKQNKVLLYDIMTERFEVTIFIQRMLSQMPELFGELEIGTIDQPAITKESVHHFFKYVSGSPLKRPAWFFDVTQQGEGLVDVMVHLLDMIQWECYPEQIIDYEKDIEVLKAKSWATELTPSMFERVTHLEEYPDYLSKDIIKDSVLNVFSNGEINYTLKGTYAKTSVIWNYEAPEGAKDTHYSIMRGTKANLIIKQGKEEGYQATLYAERAGDVSNEAFLASLNQAIDKLQSTHPGITMEQNGEKFQIIIPDKYKVGHEAHFNQVATKYLNYLKEGKMPDWEVPNMLAKYYTSTEAYAMSRK
ncbi:MAG: Gfo/Idh/MocA family oxidoreductase [Cyclobacteriaceae bacterium]|nr:Gfo/Idh/MocA family oxidoreductase [Cyclobacteriaceae bacterium]